MVLADTLTTLLVVYLAVFAALVLAEDVYFWTMVTLAARSRRRPDEDAIERRARAALARGDPGPPGDPFLVFVVPALDEALVIEQTVARLHAAGGEGAGVLVVDDGSEDETAAIVRRLEDDRTWLLRRVPPDCRQGKGEALNDAYRRLLAGQFVGPRDPAAVVMCVVDADGRISPDLAERAIARFAGHPNVVAVQCAVRMYNRDAGWLARMQDVEFTFIRHVLERARRRLGSVMLGGNGQFTRLSALAELGDAPWSDCLTEDLELGLLLLERGGDIDFEDVGEVEQQAIVRVKPLIRQRQRWYQGTLQCLRHVRLTLRAPGLPRSQRLDTAHTVVGPLLLVTSALMVPLFVFSLGLWLWYLLVAHGDFTLFEILVLGLGLPFVLAFHFVPAIAWAYRRTERMGWPRALWLGFTYILFQYHWFVAGWIGAYRQLRGRRTWAKTRRTTAAET